MEKITISPLLKTDLVPLEPILREHVRSRETDQVVEDEVQAILGYMQGEKDANGNKRKYFVARDQKGQPLGCMAYADPDPDMIKHFKLTIGEAAELLNAFVARDLMGCGIGKRLFLAICSAAQEDGKRLLVVNSGPRYQDSWGFYDNVCDKNCGFILNKYGQGRNANTWKKKL